MAAGAAVLALPVGAALVLAATPDDEPDHGLQLAQALSARGESIEVIACVLRLGERRLAVSPLDDETAEELVAGCRVAQGTLADAAREPPPEPPPADQPDTLGDDPRLDELWLGCEAGRGVDCDRLFELAPPGSGYETFGLTCGDRPDLLSCEALDVAAADP